MVTEVADTGDYQVMIVRVDKSFVLFLKGLLHTTLTLFHAGNLLGLTVKSLNLQWMRQV